MELIAQSRTSSVGCKVENGSGSARTAMRVFALLSFFSLLGTSFRAGWVQLETDFPNYYTAAVLVRQGQPLRNYYDWTWFVRQMNYAGIERQIGAYTPQTPLTMLPFVPLTKFPPQTAKRIWLTLNLVFLVMTACFLSRVTGCSLESVWLLVFCGFFSLRTNFLYGQYYIFLLFLLTLIYYFLWRGRPIAAGGIAALAFALKLYAGPLLLLFVAKRNRKAAAAMIVVTACLAIVAVAVFGWPDIKFYATQILPRSLEGGSSDPYNPGDSTISTLLRKLFVAEPELNPHPWFNAPALFFFLRTFVNLAIAVFTTLAVASRRSRDLSRDFALFVIVTLILSTSVVSYTYILLLLPAVLLLKELNPLERLCLVLLYILLTAPLRPLWLFPKVWLLLVLFLLAVRPYWTAVEPKLALMLVLLLASLALLDARRQMHVYLQEPGRHFEHVSVQPGAVLSAFPAVLRTGIVYESMGADRYVLRWLHDNKNEELVFNGHALRPLALTPRGPLTFELVAGGISTVMELDLATRTLRSLPPAFRYERPSEALSPDGKWVAFASTQDGWTQVWLRLLTDGKEERLTGGNCNNSSPVWELDSKALIFASDCDRAYGLTALYRAPIGVVGNSNPRPIKLVLHGKKKDQD